MSPNRHVDQYVFGNILQLHAGLQHRTFHRTCFSAGYLAREDITLPLLERKKIGVFVGLVTRAEPQRLRAVGPASAVDWARMTTAHDESGATVGR